MDFGVPNYSVVGFVIADFLLLCGRHPRFYSFKMGLPLAIQRALKLSNVVYLCSAALINIRAQFITEQIILYIRSFSVFLCWELSHHLHQVLLTKRFSYSLPKGSAAAETNPCEPLLAALEESIPDSLPQYLAELHFLKKLARLTKKLSLRA